MASLMYGPFQVRYVRFCRGDLGLFGPAGKFVYDDGGENTENNHDQHQFDQRKAPVRSGAGAIRYVDSTIHGAFGFRIHLMYCCMVKMGTTMPMKMVPIKPAIKKSISGSAIATAVFNRRSRSPSV